MDKYNSVMIFMAKSGEEATRARESRLSTIIGKLREETARGIEEYEMRHYRMRKIVQQARDSRPY